MHAEQDRLDVVLRVLLHQVMHGLYEVVERKSTLFARRNGCKVAGGASDEAVNVKALGTLGRMYWLITLACVSVYISAFPFFQV